MIEKNAFGRTGHESSRLIYGGAGLGKSEPEHVDMAMEVMLKYGVNHIDVAASYAKGESEKRAGVWMQNHRDKFFLATKTGMRTYEEAKAEFRSSLERLQLDSVDLIQLHNLTDPDEWETAMGSEGALEALVEAREEGLTKFIGVTGHGMTAPSIHMRSLERFDFDSVLLPCNYVIMQDPEYAMEFTRLVDICRERRTAVQVIKAVARRPWGEQERNRNCWYQPLEEPEDVRRAISWALGNPDLFVISSGDVPLLPVILEAADSAGARPSDDTMKRMVEDRQMAMIFEGRETVSKKA